MPPRPNFPPLALLGFATSQQHRIVSVMSQWWVRANVKFADNMFRHSRMLWVFCLTSRPGLASQFRVTWNPPAKWSANHPRVRQRKNYNPSPPVTRFLTAPHPATAVVFRRHKTLRGSVLPTIDECWWFILYKVYYIQVFFHKLPEGHGFAQKPVTRSPGHPRYGDIKSTEVHILSKEV
jgi:hypothetical protein